MKIHELISATGDYKIEALERFDACADEVVQGMWEFDCYAFSEGEWMLTDRNHWRDLSRIDALENFAKYLDYLDSDEDDE
ncbi:hypothetical protein [Nocardioides sp. WS12]|uniref:hypothetical protein n=1 Tax=Nocardioides sp. WS12 TaxID=2486272 RepID=UPI0015FD219E|nr:hypothetical protein [Nocardioides sp. WS12]